MFCAFALACGGGAENAARLTNAMTVKPTATPIPTPVVPKNGDYPGTGKVTKINLELGSVELDHDEIKEVMPKMIMEFFVSDKKLLKGIKVGDAIDFTLRYKDGQETIIDIKKK
jgi:Cu/Ag efflux protein CusF